MSRRPETGSLTIGANATTAPIATGAANYLYCYDQQALVRVDLFKSNQVVASHNMDQLGLVNRADFDAFTITNLSGSDNTVRFFFGAGEYWPASSRSLVTIDDSTPPVVDVGNQVDVNIVGGAVSLNTTSVSTGATSLADISCGAGVTTAVIAAGASNVRVRVSNPSTSGVILRIGCHSGVGAANGTFLHPGETWETQTSAGVWVYNPSGGAVDVARELETA